MANGASDLGRAHFLNWLLLRIMSVLVHVPRSPLRPWYGSPVSSSSPSSLSEHYCYAIVSNSNHGYIFDSGILALLIGLLLYYTKSSPDYAFCLHFLFYQSVASIWILPPIVSPIFLIEATIAQLSLRLEGSFICPEQQHPPSPSFSQLVTPLPVSFGQEVQHAGP